MAADLVLVALRHVWRALEPSNVPMAVMGGIALAIWKYPRATNDVDLLLEIGEADIDEILQTLAQADIRPKRQPPILSLGQFQLLQLLYEPPGAYLDLQIDLLLAGSDYHREALARRVPAQLPGLDFELSVLSCEDLILHKLLAGRVIDRADSAALLRINRPALDLEYLSRWARDLGLAAELGEIWDEAVPGEKPPV